MSLVYDRMVYDCMAPPHTGHNLAVGVKNGVGVLYIPGVLEPVIIPNEGSISISVSPTHAGCLRLQIARNPPVTKSIDDYLGPSNIADEGQDDPPR